MDFEALRKRYRDAQQEMRSRRSRGADSLERTYGMLTLLLVIVVSVLVAIAYSGF